MHKGNTLQTFFSLSYSLSLNLLIAPFPSFYKVTATLEDQVRALQQRIDNQDKKLQSIKSETERRYMCIYGKRDALFLFQ